MWLIVLLYMVMASTFTIGKAALSYLDPVFFIGMRMVIGGSMLLAYLVLFKRDSLRLHARDWWLFAQITLFHIYAAYIFEFWGLQYTTTAKACILYNLAPFVTALLIYLLYGQKLGSKKLIGLLIGFAGMLPVLLSLSPGELLSGSHIISTAEISLLISVVASAYGWIVMKQLVVKREYNPIMVNGFGMVSAGLLALVTSGWLEGFPPQLHVPTDAPWLVHTLGPWLSSWQAGSVVVALYTLAIIIMGNIVGYNLYGYLLHRYSAIFLSFAGFTTPIYVALLGWLFLGEHVGWSFWISAVVTLIGLYVFYQQELIAQSH